MASSVRARGVLVTFAGVALTALGCSLIAEFDESKIPAEPTTDTGVESSIDTGGPIDTGLPIDTGTPDTATPDTADTAIPDTADTAMPDTADTAIPDTADTATPDTADTATPDTADTAMEDTADTAPVDTGSADTLVDDTASPDVGDDAPAVSFSADIQPIFDARCTGCHGSSSPAAGMSLVASASYGNLVNVNSVCDSSVKRVVPADTANSMLWRKTSNTMVCGSPMPQGTSGLASIAPSEFAKLTAWINQGALNN